MLFLNNLQKFSLICNISNSITVTHLSCSNFHTSCCPTYSQLGKTMRKVLGGGSSKKKWRYTETVPFTLSNELGNGLFEKKSNGPSRRGTMLNKLYMRHLSDIMATGMCSSEILGHGIEINRVKITPDYKSLHVFWISKTTDDDIVGQILQKNAGYLRHELSQLGVMGAVPLIEFFKGKDKHYISSLEVDARLRRADFGEDYVPIDPVDKLKTELELVTPLNENIKAKIKNMQEIEAYAQLSEEEEHLPPMSQTVLGLNHEDILNRITKSINRSKASHRLSTEKQPEMSETVYKENTNPVQYANQKIQRDAFKAFLLKRQLARAKASSRNKNYSVDVEYIKEELREHHMDYFKNMDIYDINVNNDDDYIIEEDEELQNEN